MRLFLLTALLSTPAFSQLKIDFNSTNQDNGPHNQSGYQAYNAAHEVSSSFTTQSFTAFGTTIQLTPAWPNTTNNRVRQMIDRGSANDGNWGTIDLDLLTDWIGCDARSGNGGNGVYTGLSGTPTYLTLTLENIPAGSYHWTSYHHDTEHIHSNFQIEYSTDGGSTYASVTGPNGNGSFPGTDSTAGGSPASNQTYNDSTAKADLPSTVDFDFTAIAGQDVLIRFAAQSTDTVHTAFFVCNGFEITANNPEAPTDISFTGSSISKSATVGTVVGDFSTTDPTPGDTFTYTLVSGNGDTHNPDFDISGNQLLVDRDLSGYTTGTNLTIRVQTEDASGATFQKNFLITVVNDADGDGLDDTWELTYFPNLTTATGTGNNDGDNLDNLAEQAAGTNPTLTDTDGDNLADHIENGSGTYVSPTNTGSSPLLKDTDGDGLDDDVEVSPSNGHITNPNLADSDGDGFDDPFEINFGTDPNDNTDFPNTLIPLVINEIMASNLTGLEDGNGGREDWIEIYNPNNQVVNLDGYYLSDAATNLTKWNFPNVTIGANDYLIVFASGDDNIDPGGYAHTNFQLDKNGEFLAIVNTDGTTIDDQLNPYPGQFTDISYGVPSSGPGPVFFSTPTPEAANGTGAECVVNDTTFNFDRGFYDTPINVIISTATEGASIRYTTDGSKPSETVGTLYTGAIPISTTTSLRAIAYKTGCLPTNVDTHTYVFVDDVALQPDNPAGWPTDWSNSGDPSTIHPADYEMDPRVVNDTAGLRSGDYTMRNALLDIPTVSITMKPSDFLNSEAQPATGIYSNPRSRGTSWEKECSMEYIHPDGTKGFQEDCKIEIQGNASRRPARMHKHSMRVTFTSQYGPPKLRHDVFPDSGIDEFNQLVLRACFTDSWGLVSWGSTRYRPNDSMYIRDVWMKDSLGDMGQPTSHGNFVHLYVNGLYWGLHNLTERIKADFYAEHQGGEADDWEVNADLTTPGAQWNSMMSTLNGSIQQSNVYNAAKTKIDVENFADYMLLHFYADAEDWPHKNGYAAALSVANGGDGRYRFNVWDQEIALDKYTWNRYDHSQGAGAPFQRLRLNEEFRMLFADRAHKHMFNGGALSEQASIDRWLKRCTEIDKAIIGESARWGDVVDTVPYASTPGSSTNPNADYYPPLINNPIYFTREQHWIVERDNVTNNYIPLLHNESDFRSIIRELRAENLYPSIDAPVYSQFGGVVPPNFALQITATPGSIYYTLDGSDPRLEGGTISPSATLLSGSTVNLTTTGTVIARQLNAGEWSACIKAEFIVGTPATSGSIAITEIMYNPQGPDELPEFIEIMNTSGNTLDLTDVAFTDGIEYTFPTGFTLAAGERTVIVKDPTAFAAIHGGAISTAPGNFTGSLSNGGEQIILSDHLGSDILNFSYSDDAPWPSTPDGFGASLVLICPGENPDHGDGNNWRASTITHGNPGSSDASTFTGDPNADADNDGLSALLEYILGSPDADTAPSTALMPCVGTTLASDGITEHLTVTYQKNLLAEDYLSEVQLSTDLINWDTIGTSLINTTRNSDSTAMQTYQSDQPISATPQQFLRLRVVPKP